MALGKRKTEQQAAWIATNELPKSPGHPFYKKLNVLLAEAGFDQWLEKLCAPYYAANMGRDSIPPGVYFRMILVGYFEGIGSQRGIAWRCSDSRSLAEFLGVPLHEETPDHSSLSRIHDRLPLEVHEAMFVFVLKLAAEQQLLAGKTVAVDSTMLEADAAMKSIVRRATGEDWKTYLRGLAAEAGLENPTDEELRRFDKTRQDKKVSNDDWMSPNDPDSRIARMKDGTTHAAYKAEHVVDLETDLVLSATIYPADQADTETLAESVVQAQLNVIEAESPANIKEAVADKGYHAAETLAVVNETLGVRTYIPEPKRKSPWKWSERSKAERTAITANHRRVRGPRSKKLQRWRSEFVERLCSCLRDGRSETLLAARLVKSVETLSAPGRGAEPRTDYAQAVRHGHAERVAERSEPCRACVSSHVNDVVHCHRVSARVDCHERVGGPSWPPMPGNHVAGLKVAQVQQAAKRTKST